MKECFVAIIANFNFSRGLRIENCINEFLTIAETLNGYGHVLFDLHVSPSLSFLHGSHT